MQQFRVEHQETAVALAQYLHSVYQVDTKAKPGPASVWFIVEVVWDDGDTERLNQLCDAFVAGRCSLAVTAN